MKWLSFGTSYAHESVGGTEMYVHRLNVALRQRGIEATAAYATTHPGRSTHDGVPLIGVPATPQEVPRVQHWACPPYGLDAFRTVLAQVEPDVVHFHSTLQAHAPEYFEAARSVGARTLWTYHAPGQTCLQTALLRDGGVPCDGRIETTRCTRCGLIWLGLPRPASEVLARINLSKLAGAVPDRFRHPLQRRAGLELFQQRLTRAMNSLDLWVTHAEWCRQLLRTNGVRNPSITELPLPPPPEHLDAALPDSTPWEGLPSGPRLLFAGRLLDMKGAHVVLEAMRGPLRTAELSLVVLLSPGKSDYERELRTQLERDPRTRLIPPRDPAGTMAAMAAADAVVVPSIWPETGPYTVVEGFWTGAAVIGTDRGAIPERIGNHPGGAIVPANDVPALAAAIAKVVRPSEDERRARAERYRREYRHQFETALTRLLERVSAPR